MRSASGALINIAARKSQALLAYLGAKPAQRVSRDKIASLLWSSTGPDQARQSLRQTLSGLRKELSQLSKDRILIEEGDLLGLDETLVDVDVATFEQLVTSGSEEALARAIAIYDGDFLDGFTINEERFDQWSLAERDRLRRMALRAHTQLAEMQMRRGAIDDAVATVQKSLRIDPLQEATNRQLMRLYMQGGDFVNALQQFENFSRMLKRELRVEPDTETKALHRDIVQMRNRTGSNHAETAADARKTVLVVEDNVLNRELTNAVLKSAGYNVVLAKDGAEALMMIGRDKVDLLVLDVDLPYIDGHSVLQALKDNGVEVPAIFVSGLPGDEPEVRAFEIGAADFIRKPVKNSVLLARVAKVLRG